MFDRGHDLAENTQRRGHTSPAGGYCGGLDESPLLNRRRLAFRFMWTRKLKSAPTIRTALSHATS